MEKIKQSFFEVIAGEPKKEHYIHVSIVSISIAIVVGVLLMVFWNGQY
ncbi:MAG TPA: hypothetical protein VG367_03105 [Mucilaginibacter sp.]|jgi:hypothetical protein|nr:hypothetical protein [Mucilaginibacter sp.]